MITPVGLLLDVLALVAVSSIVVGVITYVIRVAFDDGYRRGYRDGQYGHPYSPDGKHYSKIL